MDSMTKDEPHPFKRLVPGHPYCVEGLRPWESGISCGRLEHDLIHQAEHDRPYVHGHPLADREPLTPADPTKCCAAETTEGVTVHEHNCPRFTPEAVAYRRARRAEVQQVMSQPLTPAEARTGISDRAAAALADVAILRTMISDIRVLVRSSAMDHLDRIEQALRAGGAA